MARAAARRAVAGLRPRLPAGKKRLPNTYPLPDRARFGEYVLQAQIGRGGYGDVFAGAANTEERAGVGAL